jgi:hypothetical protein
MRELSVGKPTTTGTYPYLRRGSPIPPPTPSLLLAGNKVLPKLDQPPAVSKNSTTIRPESTTAAEA